MNGLSKARTPCLPLKVLLLLLTGFVLLGCGGVKVTPVSPQASLQGLLEVSGEASMQAMLRL